MFSAGKEEAFDEYYTEVKEIEKRDSVFTPVQQINRLLRPGATYFNLNPFEVLQVDPAAPIDEVKKHYKRLSILVHPDKNQDDTDRAQQAFNIVSNAWRTLENQVTRASCLDVIEEAKARTDHMINDKRKKLKREGKETKVEEDDEAGYKRAIYVMRTKLFADLERKRKKLEERDLEERKRKREQEVEEEEQTCKEREWQKNFEESRQNRVNSWQDFQAGSGKKRRRKVGTSFKFPKHKAESR